MRNFKDLIEKKMQSKEFVNDDEKGIMSDVLNEFKPKSGLGERLGKMSKVTVAADDEAGLEEGLETAKDIVEEMPMEDEMSMESEMETEMTPEDIQMKIDELQIQIDELKAMLPREELPETETEEVYGEDYEDEYEF